MKYQTKIRIAWTTPTEEKKRLAGKDWRQKSAKVGKTLDEKALAGANIEWLVERGALEPVGETDGEE